MAKRSYKKRSHKKKSAKKSHKKSAKKSHKKKSRSRKRYSKGPCGPKNTKNRCGGDPNCTWTKRGCRRKLKVASGQLTYQGPVFEA